MGVENPNDPLLKRLKQTLDLGDDDLSRRMTERLITEAEKRQRNGNRSEADAWISILPEESTASNVHWYSLTPAECGEEVVEWRSIVECVDDDTGPIKILQAAPSSPSTATSKGEEDAIILYGIPVDEPAIYQKLNRSGPGILTLPGFLQFLRNLNAWSVSLAAHLFLLLLFVGVVVIREVKEEDEIISFTFGRPVGMDKGLQDKGEKGEESEEAPAEKKEEVKKEETKEETPEKKEETPVVPPVEIKKETPVELPSIKTEDPTTNADLPGRPIEGGTPTSGKGTGSSNPFAGRGGNARGELVEQNGGNKLSELAVEKGLRWLQRHQSSNGMWSAARYVEQCNREGLCGAIRGQKDIGSSMHDVGITGLSLLCYLGAGYSHKNDHPYRATVESAVAYLTAIQQPGGVIDVAGSRRTYNHVIATLALAEAYAMTADDALRRPVKRAIEYLQEIQQKGGGWDYTSDRTNRNDMSITGWVVMAFRAAEAKGIAVAPDVLDKIRDLVERRTKKTGELEYAELAPGIRRRGNGMTAVGLLCRLYLDMKDEEMTPLIANRLLNNRPDWAKLAEIDKKIDSKGDVPNINDTIDNNFYYWYYGTLAMFHMEGEYWQKWNSVLRDTLVNNQRFAGCKEGSWDPIDGWMSHEGGRIYSTTLNVLNLEIYYRYIPRFASAPASSETARDKLLRQIRLGGGSQAEKGDMISALSDESEPGIDEKLLAAWKTLTDDGDGVVRWKAILSLINLGKKEALPHLQTCIRKEKGEQLRGTYLEKLGSAYRKERSVLPFLMEFIDDPSENVRRGVMDALHEVSRQEYGRDAAKWKAWWAEQKKLSPAR
ncbi:MAG: hypothetical protein A2Z34_02720 [Planctomycetes bacterium RBG_16_59_8]|nr:MAG: hypothetical protein A2Z34_02720 [Planctomycetes bacterium RBG_16_59_8]